MLTRRRCTTLALVLAAIVPLASAATSQADSGTASPSHPSPIASKWGGTYGWCYTASSESTYDAAHTGSIVETFCTDGSTITYHSTAREASDTYPLEHLEWGTSTQLDGAYDSSFYVDTDELVGVCPHAHVDGGVEVLSAGVEITCARTGHLNEWIQVYAGYSAGRTDLAATDDNPAVPVAYYRDGAGLHYASYIGFY